jgi:beta-mannosidase
LKGLSIYFYNFCFIDEINGWIPENYPVSRMVSEYGFQSFPSYGTLKPKIKEDEDADWFGKMSDHRQHHGNGNTEMENEIQQNLKLPDKANKLNHFKSMIYLSQLNQAMSLKTSTELFIRLRDHVNETGFGMCYGAMYWQFNDIWEGVSWSSIEYGGKLKMSHYYMKDIFSNLLASPYIDHSNESFNVLLVFSEYPQKYDGEFTITVHSYDSFDLKYRETVKFSIEPHRSVLAYSEPISSFEKKSNCKFNDPKSCIIKIYYKPLDQVKSDEINENFFLMNHYIKDVVNLKIPTIKYDLIDSGDNQH